MDNFFFVFVGLVSGKTSQLFLFHHSLHHFFLKTLINILMDSVNYLEGVEDHILS